MALTNLFPALKSSPSFLAAVNLVSDQRRLASHGVRNPAQSFPAFSQFTKDLSLSLEAVKELLAVMEREFGMNGLAAHERNKARKLIPKIDRSVESHYSIVKASRMSGKTIEKVEFGFREDLPGVPQSEALIISFTDGSIMSLEGGSNAGNLASDKNGLSAEDFHIDFIVQWVPELPKSKPKPRR